MSNRKEAGSAFSSSSALHTVKTCFDAENAHHRGKFHCTADLLFDWFGFDQTSKTVCLFNISNKQLIANKISITILPMKVVLSATAGALDQMSETNFSVL